MGTSPTLAFDLVCFSTLQASLGLLQSCLGSCSCREKSPEVAAQTHPAANNSSESTCKMPGQTKQSPSTWVTITILFTVLSISSCLGNRNEGTKN